MKLVDNKNREKSRQEVSEPERVSGASLTKHKLIATNVGYTVDDVVDRLQQRDSARRAKKQLELSSEGKTPEAQTSVDDDGTDIVSQGTDAQGEYNGDTVLPGPRVLMEEDILQGYRNLASAEIQQIKVSEEWRRRSGLLRNVGAS